MRVGRKDGWRGEEASLREVETQAPSQLPARDLRACTLQLSKLCSPTPLSRSQAILAEPHPGQREDKEEGGGRPVRGRSGGGGGELETRGRWLTIQTSPLGSQGRLALIWTWEDRGSGQAELKVNSASGTP